MNKEYLNINGNCVIYDENGAIKSSDGKVATREYSDKLDEILVQENLIESLENDLKETTNNIEKRKQFIKSNKSEFVFDIVSFGSMPLLIQYIVRFSIGKEALIEIMSNGEPINTILKVVIISLSTLFGSLFATSTYSKYKTNKKRLLANESKKEAIEKSLVKEKEKLEELNKIQKPIESEDNITSTKVEYLNKLKELRNILEIYYQCGYNKNKYERYLQNGILEKKLSRYYTLEEIKLIREYLEEKKSTQVKETECKLKLCK